MTIVARLSTFRGQRPRHWPFELGKALLVRVTGLGDRPWMNLETIRWLAGHLDGTDSVLEIGSGLSTIWLAERCSKVLSLETNAEWAKFVIQRLGSKGLGNATVEFCSPDLLLTRIAKERERSFDLVIVDSLDSEAMTRVDCASLASNLVKPLGTLLLDDSHRENYWDVDRILAAWGSVRLVGFLTIPLRASEATAYTRPEAD
jgi:hypothetical protein